MVRQPYHLVEFRPWPLTGALGALSLTVGLASWFHGWGYIILIVGVTLILLTILQWWRDVIRESTYQGFHTSSVGKGLR